MRTSLILVLVLAGSAAAAPALSKAAPLVAVPAGTYRPLLAAKGEARDRPVAAFRIERHAVTNAAFAAFVKAKPRWKRGSVVPLFADENYLKHWPSAADPRKPEANRPVVHVSVFAAKAYCKWRGRRLPTLAEWEYVGAASESARFGRDDPAYNQKILDWYARPSGESATTDVERGSPNFYGVHDMHGLVWEWTSDFNSELVTGESRGDSDLDRGLFCGAGAEGATDPSDYAAFMRSAYRSSLEGNYTGSGLGFRCAADAS